MMFLDRFESLLAIAGTAFDEELRLRRQQSCQGFAEHGMIVRDDDWGATVRGALSHRLLDAIQSPILCLTFGEGWAVCFLWYSPHGLCPGQTWGGVFCLTIDEELSLLEDQVRRLKVEYDIYFGGGSKKPPGDIGWKVPNLLRKYSHASPLNYPHKFPYPPHPQKYT